MTRIIAALFVILSTGLLAGCGSSRAPEPVGIGSDRDELKRSPCGCYEIRNQSVIDA